jgi:hypothetical protein
MATILEFRRRAEAAPRGTEAEDGVLGQVIIFPGVRIERRAYEGAPAETTSAPRKRAQRRKKQR